MRSSFFSKFQETTKAVYDWYFQKYVVRSLKNFVTGSRDFDIDDTIDENEEDSAIDDAISQLNEEDA
mgnify:CR=1 FL=1